MAFTKRGIAPADPTTPVGKFRLAAGDSEYEPYAPPEPGFGLYQLWTDDEITALIAIAGGSIARAISLAYAQIGASYAASGATIKTDDLSVSVKDSVGNWLSLSRYWADIADAEDGRAVDDYFDLVDVGQREYCGKPEASPWPLSHFGIGSGGFRW